jgi:O-methyltransferase involved in polyketide biosynthesis
MNDLRQRHPTTAADEIGESMNERLIDAPATIDEMDSPMGPEKIHLTEEKETLLITLYGKALESRSKDSILGDRFADDVVRRIDYDFRKLNVVRDARIAFAMRAKWLDRWTAEFLVDHPGATVLNLGCGLDSRVFRVDPPASVPWFDVDYPEVVELRRRLYPDRDGYHLIGSSVTDPRWLAEVPVDRPAMIVAEGLLLYLVGSDVKQLLTQLTNHIPSGHLAFDGYGRLGVRLLNALPVVKATGATVRWGIDDPRDLEAWAPRLEFVEEFTAYDPSDVAKMSSLGQVLIRAWSRIPALRRLGRLLRYRF